MKKVITGFLMAALLSVTIGSSVCYAKDNTACSEKEILTQKADEILSGMTLEDKIYQMFIVTPEQLAGNPIAKAPGDPYVTVVEDPVKMQLEQRPVGGLIFFASNLVSAEQTKAMLTDYQSFAEETNGLPLFLCVDEEGGRVARIGRNEAFDVMRVPPMAAVQNEEQAFFCGTVIGAYLSDLGFNVDFAPDADVITNSSNTVIRDRSFGSDAQIVTKYAVAYSDGLHANGVMSTFKHFPGHGSTEADTHAGYAYTNRSYEELLQAELQPFLAAGENGVDMVMVSHIAAPAVTGNDIPASLSEKLISEILKGDLHYEGLVITDALDMGAISVTYDSSEAVVEAVKAGVDILLMPVDLNAAYSGVYTAVISGEIPEERIDESVRKILISKMKLQED